ncbi:MAG: SPFH domain-containing protein, partial [Casimicrobiaceae bacterium]
LIPIGYVGVVISYYGASGKDVTGAQFRYGEQVESGSRGVWREALAPGKYALNPYALKVEHVPTVNFVLRWISGQVEAHRYDEHLTSIPLITADGYEPLLPLSLVLHIDYEKAPRVVQRFGDVRRLITQTLDPILTAYFRDVAQSSHMLDLLTRREDIQRHATEELGRRFQEFDINCVAVLIGRPESALIKPGQEDPIDRLFNQLRQRRLAEEQKETFAKQQEAAAQQKQLNQALAEADRQTHLTETRIEIEIAGNRGAAQLAEAERLAKREITLAEGHARAVELDGQGEAAKIAQVGQAEADVSRQKVAAFTDPRLYALNLVAQQLAHSSQPLVPERVVLLGGGDGKDAVETGLFQSILQVMTAWKEIDSDPEPPRPAPEPLPTKLAA